MMIYMVIESSKYRAVFIDRDGTINEEVGYLDSPDKFKLLPRSADAINMLNSRGYKVVVVTNQAGVARGYFTEQTVHEIHNKMVRELQAYGCSVDGIYYCPHHPEVGNEKYRLLCDCRKPKSGMFIRAARELEIDLRSSYAIGDQLKDLEAGMRAGCKTILVLTGYGVEEQKKLGQVQPDYIATDLYEAVQWLINTDK
jgi:D-glycero-D-manno-heptose 1,7-bisphosphate phosphatase